MIIRSYFITLKKMINYLDFFDNYSAAMEGHLQISSYGLKMGAEYMRQDGL